MFADEDEARWYEDGADQEGVDKKSDDDGYADFGDQDGRLDGQDEEGAGHDEPGGGDDAAGHGEAAQGAVPDAVPPGSPLRVRYAPLLPYGLAAMIIACGIASATRAGGVFNVLGSFAAFSAASDTGLAAGYA